MTDSSASSIQPPALNVGTITETSGFIGMRLIYPAALVTYNSVQMRPPNPHFDEHKIVWRDEYSGRYASPPDGYEHQFDLEWKLAIEGHPGYFDNPGASTDDAYIDDRIYEWTGKHPRQLAGFADGAMGVR